MIQDRKSDSEVLRFERRGPVAWLTLNRPHVGNSINRELALALKHAALQASEDTTVRLVVLTGRGRLFCGGGDVRSFADPSRSASAAIDEITEPLHAAVHVFARMAKPLLTLINGPAGGAGLSLAALGDVAIAAQSAHFTSAYTNLGLTPDGGGSWLLPHLVGLRRAQELVLTNRRLTATEAVAWGLITSAVPDNELDTAADAMIARLTNLAPGALAQAKRLLYAGLYSSLEDQMQDEARTISRCASSPEGVEGVAAFFEKRDPVF